MSISNAHETIPQPPSVALLGNLLSLEAAHPLQSLMRLAQEYGPIFQLDLPGRTAVYVSGPEMVDELCDEKRFDKMISAPLRNVRDFTGDGLFTSGTQEPNWHKAHDILLPNFSMKAMQGYMPMMLDLAVQLMQKWERLNPDDVIDVAGDMTRLTLDTIGLCGFGYRFNSFYSEKPHDFIEAMVRALEYSLARLHQLPIQTTLQVKARRQFEDDIEFMNDMVDKIVSDRKASGEQGHVKDLLSYMLNGIDKHSGEGLDDVNIRYQIITFLIAGHETTSGLLSFAMYYLLKNPDVLARAYAEVDRVLGADLSVLPTYAQTHQLTYITQILNESLRLWPTAPIFTVYPYEDTVLGGKYALAKGGAAVVLIPSLHRDKSVWGDDAEQFNPDRFSPSAQNGIPANAFKPFGNGQRACIGRQFAMQEAALVLGMILQRFELDDFNNYQLHIKETLTLKPQDLEIKVRPRPDRTVTLTGSASVMSASSLIKTQTNSMTAITAADLTPPENAHHTPLLVLYGSNLGTAEGIAGEIAQDGANRGFAVTLGALDDYIGKLPTEGAVTIVSASYNGTPPDNAARFCAWLIDPALPKDAFAGVKYTVFGCGNRDWAATYQAVPTLIDSQMAAHGAQSVFPRGEGDARDDFDGQFRSWYSPLWPAMAKTFSLDESVAEGTAKAPALQVAFVNKRSESPTVTSFNAYPVTVTENRELQRSTGNAAEDRSTRHVELTLPAGVTYSAGDHLGILPRNGVEPVKRVLDHFGLDAGEYVSITSSARTFLPVNQTVPVIDVLANYVELQDVATRNNIKTLADYATEPETRQALLALTGDDASAYRDQVFNPHRSILDLLDEYPDCQPSFAVFLEMLPPLRPRYYSISSSPMVSADKCSITVAVVNAPARSGHGVYHGVASSYLSTRGDNSRLFAFVHKPNLPFHPPENPHTPMIMVGAGTGLAPFRGFLQERAALKSRGVPVGESLLFFGCRNSAYDFIYEDELQGYVAQGILRMSVACSRVPGKDKSYVQHIIAQQADDVWALLQHNASIYVCGDAGKMAPDVQKAFIEVFRTRTGTSEGDAQAWMTGLIANQRYLEDVWASG